MKTQIHDTITELHDFVEVQGAEDAVLSLSERRYQRDLVKDVLAQEPIKPAVQAKLVREYTQSVANHLGTRQTA